METNESAAPEESGLKHCLSMAGVGAFLGLALGCVLWLMVLPLQFSADGKIASASVLLSCIYGSAMLIAPALSAFFVPLMAAEKHIPTRHMALALVASTLAFYAAFCVAAVNFPKWDKIVVNTRDGYHDFQAHHQNEGREASYRQAEWVAEVTRPVWEWLANR